MTPEVHYARNGDTALAYQVVGDGPSMSPSSPASLATWTSPGWRAATFQVAIAASCGTRYDD